MHFFLGFFWLLCCLNSICLQLLNSICYKFVFLCFYITFGLKFFPVVICLPYWGFWWGGNGNSLKESSIYSLIHWSRTEFYILLMKEWSSRLIYNASKIIYPCFLLCINLKLCITVLFFSLFPSSLFVVVASLLHRPGPCLGTRTENGACLFIIFHILTAGSVWPIWESCMILCGMNEVRLKGLQDSKLRHWKKSGWA